MRIKLEVYKKLYLNDQDFESFFEDLSHIIEQEISTDEVSSYTGFFRAFYNNLYIDERDVFPVRNFKYMENIYKILELYLEEYGSNSYADFYRYILENKNVYIDIYNCRWRDNYTPNTSCSFSIR